MLRFVRHPKLRRDRLFRSRAILRVVYQLPDQLLAVLFQPRNQSGREETRRLRNLKRHLHPTPGSQFTSERFVFVRRESRVEGVPIKGNHEVSMSLCGDGSLTRPSERSSENWCG